jgi:hypothetical protein
MVHDLFVLGLFFMGSGFFFPGLFLWYNTRGSTSIYLMTNVISLPATRGFPHPGLIGPSDRQASSARMQFRGTRLVVVTQKYGRQPGEVARYLLQVIADSVHIRFLA